MATLAASKCGASPNCPSKSSARTPNPVAAQPGRDQQRRGIMQGDGRYEGDESVPQHGEPGQPDFETGLQPKSRGMSSLYRLTRDARQWRTRVRPAQRQAPGRLGQPHRPPTLTTSPRPRTTHRVGRRHRRRKSNPPPPAVKPIATTTWSGLRTRRAPVAANRNASDSPLVPRGRRRRRATPATRPAVPRPLR